ncbi:hypothetical protein CC86DRAFT_111143 [Ophiobolus disseminans]|uniref:Uncharacterized protein n=1 Tax=Ophiobolus disseminans TaxID=1469910 RepID=A0A6A6ZKR3_9PLEO|nr:hypothetical protein CC86DRAFT_111143 [Ophiobolus disseminans]
MLFTSTIVYIVLGFATQAIAAPLEASVDVVPRGALIATSPYYACNCPNNCKYKNGTGCRFKAGPSTNSPTISGSKYSSTTIYDHCSPRTNPGCQWVGADLTCVAK